jgi:hypothetical protein
MKTDHRTRKLIKKIQQRIREEKMLKEIEKWVEDDVKKRRGRWSEIFLGKKMHHARGDIRTPWGANISFGEMDDRGGVYT